MKTIFLSAGHSETDPGATTSYTDNKTKQKVLRREADIAVETRNMVSFYLAQAGVPHAVDGKGTTNLPLPKAAALAKQYNIGVEFHCNAAGNPKATGAETLSQVKVAALASKISGAIATSLGIANRGAKPEDSGQHSRLAFCQAGGIIVELFFLSNPADLAAYDARKWLMAKAIADVLMAAAK